MNIELALYQFLKENIRKSLSLHYLFNCWIKIPLNILISAHIKANLDKSRISFATDSSCGSCGL